MPYSDTIRNQIADCDRRSTNVINERTRQQKILAQLRKLKSYVSARQTNFNQIQDRRHASLYRLQTTGLQTRSAEGYTEQMLQLVNGNQRVNVDQTYTDMLHRLDTEIEDAELEIHDAARILGNIAEDKAYYQHRLDAVAAEEKWEAQKEHEHEQARRNGEC